MLLAGQPHDQLEVLHQAAHGEELIAHSLLGLLPDRASALGLSEQPSYGFAVRAERGRLVEQDAAAAVDDLVLDPADPRSDDWTGFPHRLRDG